MKPSLLQELTLYRYRYFIGYALVVVFVLALLLVDINSVPNGLRNSEIASSVASNSLNPLAPNAADVVNLPYHMLQKLSIGLFGLSPLTIRLPSIVLGFLACLILGVTLNLWFRKNIATIALLLAITSAPFVAMSRTGTAAVLYMLLLLFIMLSAAMLTTQKRGTFVWKLLVIAAGILLLYMPLGVYAVAALFIAGIFHPHVRYQIKRTKWWQYLVSLVVIGVLLAPIVLASMADVSTLQSLLGLSELQEKLQLGSLWASIVTVAKTVLSFHKPSISEVMTPFLSLTFTLLVLFGLTRSIIDRHAARSYLLHIWLLISIPLLILNPTNFPLLFVPCMFLMAIGLETFMREWYEVFPRNPYARIGALIPLSLIVIGMIAVATSRFFYGYYYTDTREVYSPELSSVRQILKPHVKTQLIVPESQVAFYDILRSKYPLLSIHAPSETRPASPELIVLARTEYAVSKQPSRIITSHYKKEGVILRVYNGTQ